MKKLSFVFGSLLFVGLLYGPSLQAQIQTPMPSPSCKVTQTLGLGEVTLDYSRPGVKERTIFGDLVPYGQVWRTGANQATKISFSEDVKFGGKEVKAGTYALYTIPGKESWSIMLYSDLSLGGNVANYDESKEVARVTAKPDELPFSVETFTMMFQGMRDDHANLLLYWDKTLVAVPVEVEVTKKVMASIDRTMAGPSANDYYAAAQYYMNNDKDMDKALTWINKAVEMRPEAFWMMTTQAVILGKTGNKTKAIETAMKAKELSEKAGFDNFVKMNEDNIATWKGSK